MQDELTHKNHMVKGSICTCIQKKTFMNMHDINLMKCSDCYTGEVCIFINS